MVKPLTKPKITHKRKAKFVQQHADRYGRVPEKWRAPRGIDSVVRRRFRDRTNTVKIGYGTNKKHRHVLASGFKRFLINNVKELEMLMMNNRVYAAEVAHSVSVKTRRVILERAAQLNIKVLNGKAKLRTEETE